eukprot:s1473_g3.t4
MDLNHRPALGSWNDLWQMAEPHLQTLDLLVFSIGDVIQVGEVFGENFAADFKALKEESPGRAGAAGLDALVRKCVVKQSYLGNRTNIAVTCKARDQVPGELPQQLRWSILCRKDGTLLSTYETAVPQQVKEDLPGSSAAAGIRQIWLKPLTSPVSPRPRCVVADFCWQNDIQPSQASWARTLLDLGAIALSRKKMRRILDRQTRRVHCEALRQRRSIRKVAKKKRLPKASCWLLLSQLSLQSLHSETRIHYLMPCMRAILLSTLGSAIQEIGGGDSWLSGVIDGLVGCPEAGAAAPSWSDKMWLQAMQRGDMLAALKQQVLGDFSNVERSALELVPMVTDSPPPGLPLLSPKNDSPPGLKVPQKEVSFAKQGSLSSGHSSTLTMASVLSDDPGHLDGVQLSNASVDGLDLERAEWRIGQLSQKLRGCMGRLYSEKRMTLTLAYSELGFTLVIPCAYLRWCKAACGFLGFLMGSLGDSPAGRRGPERFFYDKTTYTGVHTCGGPSTVCKDSFVASLRNGLKMSLFVRNPGLQAQPLEPTGVHLCGGPSIIDKENDPDGTFWRSLRPKRSHSQPNMRPGQVHKPRPPDSNVRFLQSKCEDTPQSLAHMRLALLNSRALVSSPFTAAGLEDLRLMVFPEGKELTKGPRSKRQRELYAK